MIAALIGLLLPVAAIWLSGAALASRVFTRGPAILGLALAFAVGIGASSVTTFWFVVSGGTLGRGFVAADALLWTTTCAVATWCRRRRPSVREHADAAGAGPSRQLTPTDRLARAAFVLVAAMALATVATEYMASPHGQWDAWAIWNQRARFLIRGGPRWTDSLAVAWSQPSHPLLVSASVARLWSYAGAELTAVPAMLGLAFGLAIVGVVMGTLDLNRTRAWIAGTVLLAPGTFPQQVAAQTADLPTGLFVVATLIMLRTARQVSSLGPREARDVLLLLGALGGLAAWTKNEGLLLLGVTGMMVAWATLRRGDVRRWAWWAVGTIPPLATIAWLKLSITVPPGYFSATDSAASIVARLFAPERHAMVGSLAWNLWIHWGGSRAAGVLPMVMVAAAIVALTRGGRSVRGAAAAVIAMLGGYYAVWLMSPLDTAWLVSTSFDRLAVQLWPSLVLIAFAWDGEADKT